MAANLSENIVKINSKVLEAAELKKLDKLEKEFLFFNHGAVKGKPFYTFAKPSWLPMSVE
jgi:hypothetical protein